MGLFSFLGKKNYVEEWKNTPQDEKEKQVAAAMWGYLRGRMIFSGKPGAELEREVNLIIEQCKCTGIVKDITDRITKAYIETQSKSFCVPPRKIIGSCVGSYFRHFTAQNQNILNDGPNQR